MKTARNTGVSIMNASGGNSGRRKANLK